MPAAALTATAVVGSSLIGASATGKAVKAQSNSADAANALQKYMYDQTRSDQMPWHDAGTGALAQLQEFLKPGADMTKLLQAQPGYQARLNEGVNAIDRSAAANGSLNSGGTLKALTRYGQDYASNELTNVLNRYYSMAGLGQTANNSMGAAGSNYANNAGNNLMAAGNARASGYLANGQIAGNALGGLAGAGAYGANSSGWTMGGGGFNNPLNFGSGLYNPPAPAPVSAYGFGSGPNLANYSTNVSGLTPTSSNFGGF